MNNFKAIRELYDINKINGFNKNDIDYIEGIFGKLPQLLTNYYQELANYDFNYVQDFLLKANDFKHNHFIHPDYLTLYSENQGCNLWILKKEDLDKDNPPVYNLINDNCILECNTLSEFLEAISYLQSLWCLKYPNEGFYQLDYDEDILFVKNNFKNKDVCMQTHINGIEFYGDHADDIIIIMGETCLFYASNSEEHHKHLYEKLKKGLIRDI